MPPPRIASLCALTLLGLLSACPGGGSGAQQSSPPEADGDRPPLPEQESTGFKLPEQLHVSYPPMVSDYVLSTLRDPATHDHASLGLAWEAISRLADGSVFNSTISTQIQLTSSAPSLELVSAWLACDPAASSTWLLNEVQHGAAAYLGALQNQPRLGREVLRQLDLSKASRELTEPVLSLLRSWEPLQESDEAVLQQLAQSGEVRTQLRAIGYLYALDKASERQLTILKDGLRSSAINTLASAAEACRICRRPELAQVLVQPAALIPVEGEEGLYSAQNESTGLYTAYALSYLPGDQAKLLRQRLLTAKDQRIRWQARLGELLNGDMQPWYDALLAAAPEDEGPWLALQPENLAHPALLLTYKRAAGSGDELQRLRAAQQLNRYAAYSSEPLVRELLKQLMQDKSEAVAAQAWHSAAVLRLPGCGADAQRLLDAAIQPGSVRLAAALYLLLSAEPQAAGESG